MANFRIAHKFTAQWEGGRSDDAQDAGGYTAYGVSTTFVKSLLATPEGRKFMSGLGFSGKVDRAMMRRIGPADAARIFRWYFWEPFNLEMYVQPVATVYYDCMVNHGRGGGTRLAQKGVNRVHGPGTLAVDSLFGPKTFSCLREAGLDVARATIEARKEYYRAIVAAKPSQGCFLRGWLNRANALGQYILKP